MELSGLRCLVTGGAGFIGSHLVELLLASGCSVTVLDNFATGRRSNLPSGAEIVDGSILDREAVRSAVDRAQVVFHLACLGVRHSLLDPFENHRVNAEGTLVVLEECSRLSLKRFVYCSSSEVYGSAILRPISESHPTFPHTVYGASKLAGEMYARAFFLTSGMPVTVVRPFNTFGPRSHHEGISGEMIPKSIVRSLSGRPVLLFGDGSQSRDFTYVTDTAKAILGVARTDSCVGGTFNAGSETAITMSEVAEAIVRRVGESARGIERTDRRPGDLDCLIADASRIRSDTGWAPTVSFADGLDRTIEHFRSHPAGIEALALEESGRNW